ncbi:MAG TPA: peptide ABC transporter substrate-binding protein [Candidatus Eisenbacteria bacterium]|nr:peptide ABC transporter substrate-binding protein [Candidatus Eisenbacteria bacterium]
MLAACQSGSTPTSRLAADQSLKFPVLHDFGTLDPAVSDAETDMEIQQNLFNGLIKFDNNLNIVADLATSVPQPADNGLTYTFQLRHDVIFSNGDKLTSKDVLYSWNRAAAMQGSYATNLAAIEGYAKVAQNTASGSALQALLEKNDPSVILTGLTAPDDYTVKVKLSLAAGWFLSAIAVTGATGTIVDQNAVKTDFDKWWTKPETLIGTGPFKMAAHVADQSVDFVAIDNWWGSPKPTVKRVHLDIVSDGSGAIAKYEQGVYDIYGYGGFSNPPVADIARIQGTPNEKDQLLIRPKVSTMWVSFNLVADVKRQARGPFSLDQGQSAHDLRLAFALAVDKKKLVTSVCADIACSAATGGLIPKGLIGYMGDGQDPLGKYDPARAKQLFQGADPTGAKTKGLVYVYDPSNGFNKPTAEFLRAQWHDNLGVDVELQSVSHSQFIRARLNGQYVLSRDGWKADYNHPQDWFDNLWGHVVGCPDSNCTSGYDTKAYDSLLDKADAQTGDLAIADYRKLNQMLIDDVVYIPLYYSNGSYLIKPYVRGAGANNFFEYRWNEIQLLSHQ